MKSHGFTLLELSMSMALLATFFVVLMGLELKFGAASSSMLRNVSARDGARHAIQEITRELRQAQVSSVAIEDGGRISYRVPVDTDGNGSALDRTGGVELSSVRTIGRDRGDLNHDGLQDTQLVLSTEKGFVRVLANGLITSEAGGAGPMRGLRFEAAEEGIRFVVETTPPRSVLPGKSYSMASYVRPRN